ncbi:MAG: nucleotidyltransferase family protein [Syntrophales bacterium]|nr:nucleotidyltransferase family protein [Syntrophales bacterium]
MTWSREDHLLLYCCRTKNGDPLEIRDIDWNVFLEKARNEGISPLVFSRLPEIAAHYDIPKYVTEELKKDYYLSATKNALIFEELKKVLGLFNQRELQVIVMKGAALAETVYGNPALRSMSDVDLLVKNEDLHRVDELLKKLGYSPADRSVDDVDFTSTYLTTLDYRNPAKNAPSFHVHWHFVNSTIPNESYIGYIKMDDIWRDAVRATIADTETWVMSPHHLIIHLSEHALRVTHSLSKLSYFCDIDRVINYYGKGLDWDILVRDTIKFNLNKMVYTTLYFSAYFVKANVPEDVLLKLKPKRFSIPEKIFMRKTAENKRIPGMSYLIHLSMNKGLAKKLKFVGKTLFPPKDILAQRSYISEADMNYRYYLNRIREVLSRIFKV